jgi:hypothetical protein
MSLLNKLLSQSTLRIFLITLGWGTCFAGVTLWAIFQGTVLPRLSTGPPTIWLSEPLLLALYYSMIFGVSFLSGLYVGDLGKAIVVFLTSYLVSAIIIYEVLVFPGAISSDIGFRETLAKFAVNWTFNALFPFPLFLGLFGGIIGAGLQETIVG